MTSRSSNIIVLVSIVVIFIISPDQFSRQCAVSHNHYRYKHRTQYLTVSQKLVEYAQSRAIDMAKTNDFNHIDSNPYGENLFKRSSSSGTREQMVALDCNWPVKLWYDEIDLYDFDRGKQKPGTKGTSGHFTQVVWKRTGTIGCAKSFSDKTHTMYVICQYDPPGNVIGLYKENVPKLY
ncbi:uncharacterized protein LOC128959643 [Oppia nitens]|uniref:uncharacterized protein LOC128959643 n=1 Tax=Oppia nitens TaxID=1686743 RepID=UPI0023DCB133|nr:uncharacterized protein LOC128959643 [Oppia nitens]